MYFNKEENPQVLSKRSSNDEKQGLFPELDPSRHPPFFRIQDPREGLNPDCLPDEVSRHHAQLPVPSYDFAVKGRILRIQSLAFL